MHNSNINNRQTLLLKLAQLVPMLFKSCQCCLKINEIELKVMKIIEEISHIKNRGYAFKFDTGKQVFGKENLTQTLLLDFSEAEQPKYTLGSINQSLTKLSNKINEFQLKCSILPSIKQSISKQTQIIHYLQGRIQTIANQKTESVAQTKLPLKKCNYATKDYQTSPIALRKQRKVLQPMKYSNQQYEGV